jgi:hypothetical protein
VTSVDNGGVKPCGVCLLPCQGWSGMYVYYKLDFYYTIFYVGKKVVVP